MQHAPNRKEDISLADRVGIVLLCIVAGTLSLTLIAGSILTLWSTQFWLVTPVSSYVMILVAYSVLRQRYTAAFMTGVALLSVNLGLGAVATIAPQDDLARMEISVR